MKLCDHTGQQFEFDAGSAALELLATRVPGGTDALETSVGTAAWLESTERLFDSRDSPAVTLNEPGLKLLRTVRDAVQRCVDAIISGAAFDDASPPLLEEAAQTGPLVPVFQRVDGGDIGWPLRAGWAPCDVARIASTCAGDAIRVLSPPTNALIRQCASVDCTLTFLDTSRGHRRRWCSMERCGNRAKVRKHRHMKGDNGDA